MDRSKVDWKCPKGHHDYDFLPLPEGAFCTECGDVYEWDDVLVYPARREAVEVTA